MWDPKLRGSLLLINTKGHGVKVARKSSSPWLGSRMLRLTLVEDGSRELWGIEEGAALDKARQKDSPRILILKRGISPLISVWMEKPRSLSVSTLWIDEDRVVTYSIWCMNQGVIVLQRCGIILRQSRDSG